MTNSEAIETLKANYPDSCYGLLREAIDTAIYALSAQPVAKPEIIHCCECKYWKPGYITDDDDFVPPSCAVGWVPGYWHANDYCSCAERRQK